MRQLLVYLFIGLATAAFIFLACQRLARHTSAYIITLQEQRLQEQVPCEQPEAYQPTREQLHLIESYADIVTETEADYLETMGRHSPYYKEYLTQLRNQFPHVTPIELWDLIYEKEKDFLNRHGRVSQRIIDKIKDSKERAEAIKRIFGDKEQKHVNQEIIEDEDDTGEGYFEIIEEEYITWIDGLNSVVYPR